MENNNSHGGGNGAVMAVVVLVVIVIAAWLAYKQGYIGGKEQASDEPEIEINY